MLGDHTIEIISYPRRSRGFVQCTAKNSIGVVVVLSLFTTIIVLGGVILLSRDLSYLDSASDADNSIPQTSAFESYVSQCFEEYVQDFKKTYSSFHERDHRYNIFRQNLARIFVHNADSSRSTTLGVGPFADLTETEFRERMLIDNTLLSNTTPSLASVTEEGLHGLGSAPEELPLFVDWRTSRCLPSVKKQKACESASIFGVMAAIETHACYASSSKTTFDLSEQQVEDCSAVPKAASGCEDIRGDEAYRYIEHVDGLCDEEDYEYTGRRGDCRERSCDKRIRVNRFWEVPPGNRTALKATLANRGPAIVGMKVNAFEWQHYRKGLLTSPQCNTATSHVALVVGYGTSPEREEQFWEVMNSWGTDWGDKGFARLLRDDDRANREGKCGILSHPFWPEISILSG